MLIEYKAIDNAGNEEERKSFTISIDRKPPRAEEITYIIYKEEGWWYLELTASATDITAGMGRVEFFIRNKHYETITGPGPDYVFTVKWTYKVYEKILYFNHYDRAGNLIIVEGEIGNLSPPPPPPTRDVIGIICNREISEENVSFFAIVVFEPLTFKPFILEHVIFPNNYTGYIGRSFIRASFYE
jgi:hypothetical protein